MRNLPFEWAQPVSLAEELSRPIARLSFVVAAHQRPVLVTLWHPGGTGIKITCGMRQIGVREELGVLTFEHALPSETDDVLVRLPQSFGQGVAVQKLTIHEMGHTAESGVALKAPDGKELLITAGAYPCSLAITGVPVLSHLLE